jgi:long-chain fatty acid transport protein
MVEDIRTAWRSVSMKTRKTILLSVLLAAGLSSFTFANGLNLNGLGSRAVAMGGAFVALADDFSAVFWNPAGLSNFKKRTLGFYGVDLIPSASYLMQVPVQNGLLTLVDAKTKTKHYLAGLGAYYQPINDQLVVGIGVSVPSGLGATWDGNEFINLQDYELGLPAGQHSSAYQWESRIGRIAISPAASYKINDMISIGAALNIEYGMFSLKRWAGAIPAGSPPKKLDLGQYDDSSNGWGVGATFGVLVKANSMLSFGAAVRTPAKIKFTGSTDISNINLVGLQGASDTEKSITFPWWVAGGVAFRPREDLVVTADLQWTKWSQENSIETTYKDLHWSLFFTQAGQTITPLKWKDSLQIRFGAEYKLYQNVAIRAGYYYDPAPGPDKTLNVLMPTFNFNAFTIGAGWDLGGLVIDVGGELLLGRQRTVDFAKWLLDPAFASSMPGLYKMTIFVPNLSISYKF